ncbi:hypothetical protein HK102_005053, partial [Quaeritorhiza haematococci]
MELVVHMLRSAALDEHISQQSQGVSQDVVGSGMPLAVGAGMIHRHHRNNVLAHMPVWGSSYGTTGVGRSGRGDPTQQHQAYSTIFPTFNILVGAMFDRNFASSSGASSPVLHGPAGQRHGVGVASAVSPRTPRRSGNETFKMICLGFNPRQNTFEFIPTQNTAQDVRAMMESINIGDVTRSEGAAANAGLYAHQRHEHCSPSRSSGGVASGASGSAHIHNGGSGGQHQGPSPVSGAAQTG